MKKLSKKEWVATAVAVALVAYLFFAGDIMSLMNRNASAGAMLNDLNGISLDSGVLINEIVSGQGVEVKEGDLLTTHYILSLSDGTTIGNSRDFGVPFSFVLGAGEVIPGFDEGLKGMKVGGVRTIVIPSELAYGETGQGPIPPNSTLIFTIELLSIESSAETVLE